METGNQGRSSLTSSMSEFHPGYQTPLCCINTDEDSQPQHTGDRLQKGKSTHRQQQGHLFIHPKILMYESK